MHAGSTTSSSSHSTTTSSTTSSSSGPDRIDVLAGIWGFDHYQSSDVPCYTQCIVDHHNNRTQKSQIHILRFISTLGGVQTHHGQSSCKPLATRCPHWPQRTTTSKWWVSRFSQTENCLIGKCYASTACWLDIQVIYPFTPSQLSIISDLLTRASQKQRSAAGLGNRPGLKLGERFWWNPSGRMLGTAPTVPIIIRVPGAVPPHNKRNFFKMHSNGYICTAGLGIQRAKPAILIPSCSTGTKLASREDCWKSEKILDWFESQSTRTQSPRVIVSPMFVCFSDVKPVGAKLGPGAKRKSVRRRRDLPWFSHQYFYDIVESHFLIVGFV